MYKDNKYKLDKGILIPLILFALISIISIFATRSMISSELSGLFIKQFFWYGLGFIVIFIIMKLGNRFLYDNAYIFYIVGVILLILVLFFGVERNNAICWFKIPYIGTFQPSEFMKIALIITLTRLIGEYNQNSYNDIMSEFKFLLKILFISGIPAILTFIEPDTGAVLIYFIITITMLFIGGIRSRWFIFTIGTLIILLSLFTGLYFFNQDLFIEIFGTSFFYRMDRILSWYNTEGMQLTNSLTAIGSAGVKGHGFNNIPIYFPEMQTDFIFPVFASNFGFIGSLLLLGIIFYFDSNIITLANKSNDIFDKLSIAGIISILLFQQLWNISMTVGILPIMGITLPFISYGGSSLLSYMILMGIIFNISNDSLRYKN